MPRLVHPARSGGLALHLIIVVETVSRLVTGLRFSAIAPFIVTGSLQADPPRPGPLTPLSRGRFQLLRGHAEERGRIDEGAPLKCVTMRARVSFARGAMLTPAALPTISSALRDRHDRNSSVAMFGSRSDARIASPAIRANSPLCERFSRHDSTPTSIRRAAWFGVNVGQERSGRSVHRFR